MIFDTRASKQNFLQVVAAELAAADPVLGRIIREVGPCNLDKIRRSEYFASLVEAIIYQQLAGSAAAAILARFRKLYAADRFPTAEEIHRTPTAELRAAGLSPQKISYLQDLL